MPTDEPDRALALADLATAELVAARAADTAGGGSPCWGRATLGPGEELALAVEVGRALRNIDTCNPLNPYPDMSQS